MAPLAAWSYVGVWPIVIIAAWFLSRRMGGKSAVDAWLLAIGLAVEFVLAVAGGLATGGNCDLPDGALLISDHVGNLVTSSAFAVACLSAYLNFSGPTLAVWISLEADEVLRHYGLKVDGKYLFPLPAQPPPSHAAQVFEACLDLPLTVKELRRSRMRQGLTSAPAADARKACWEQASSYLNLGKVRRRMIEGRGDQWLAAAAIWLMIFVTGQSLILFLTEVFLGDQRVACWLSSAKPWVTDLPMEFSYVISFAGIIVGVGLFRFRSMIQTSLEARLADHAHDLSMQVLSPKALEAIGRVGA